jgi:hypothetical protein
MLGVNMQTSFMHPPFGFALFYLRSVAAREPFKDKVTGKMTEPVTTGQIYWGAVPFVVIQCIMVGLVITFPGMVMHYKAAAPTVDPSKIEIQVPTFGKDGGVGLVLPPLGSGFGQGPNIPLPTFPTLPNTAPDLGGTAPKAQEPSGEGARPTEPKEPEERK